MFEVRGIEKFTKSPQVVQSESEAKEVEEQGTTGAVQEVPKSVGGVKEANVKKVSRRSVCSL